MPSPVSHGIVPTVAYRIDRGDIGLVFATDQNASDAAFAKLAHDADAMVMHMAIPSDAGCAARSLHATPN